MGTELLRPQDCLTFTNHRIRITPVNVIHRRKTHYHGNGIPKINGYRKQPVRSDRFPAQRNHSPKPMMISKRSASTSDLSYKPQNNNNNTNSNYRIATSTSNNSLASGNVAILKRGESLESKIEPTELGITDIYAGSAFSMSPSPRALPLPSFFNSNNDGGKCVDDLATRDLRRLLRLE